MIQVQWMLNTTSGPAVGEKECNSLSDAWEVLDQNVRQAFPNWTEQHESAMTGIKGVFEREAEQGLEEQGEWTYRTTAVSLTLSRNPGQQYNPEP